MVQVPVIKKSKTGWRQVERQIHSQQHGQRSQLASSEDNYRTTPSTAGSEREISVSDRPALGARRRAVDPPSEGLEPRVSRILNKAPATNGKVRCMRWSQLLNESLVRAYYRATDEGTILTAYSSRLLFMFQEFEPTVTCSSIWSYEIRGALLYVLSHVSSWKKLCFALLGPIYYY